MYLTGEVIVKKVILEKGQPQASKENYLDKTVFYSIQQKW